MTGLAMTCSFCPQVLHYSGNLDVIVSVAMTEAFLDHVHWSGRDQYCQSSRQKWFVDGKLVGWFITVGNFTRVCALPLPFTCMMQTRHSFFVI